MDVCEKRKKRCDAEPRSSRKIVALQHSCLEKEDGSRLSTEKANKMSDKEVVERGYNF